MSRPFTIQSFEAGHVPTIYVDRWLYVPRGCAILYVPLRNHHLIRTTFPTSHGFQRLPEASIDALIPGSEISEDLLGDLFAWAATIDMTPYLCVPEALKFREQVCGGEAAIRQYCFDLAQRGGRLMADILQTESMDNETRTLSQCCFTMVRLPLTFGESKPLLYPGDGPTYVKWIMEQLMQDHDTWIPAKFYRGAIWVRVSAQIYLELKDFEWAARVLGDICDRISAG